MLRAGFALVFSIFSVVALQAQTASTTTTDSDDFEIIEITQIPTTSEWMFSAIDNERLQYVDFEQLQDHLTDLLIKDAAGNILYRENVSQLPTNTIYEIDFSQYEGNRFQVELRSFTGVISKGLELK